MPASPAGTFLQVLKEMLYTAPTVAVDCENKGAAMNAMRIASGMPYPLANGPDSVGWERAQPARDISIRLPAEFQLVKELLWVQVILTKVVQGDGMVTFEGLLINAGRRELRAPIVRRFEFPVTGAYVPFGRRGNVAMTKEQYQTLLESHQEPA